MSPHATHAPSSARTPLRILSRLAAVMAAVGLVAACDASDPLTEDLPDMGDFRLAHNIVVAENMQQVPPSRNATSEEWVNVMTSEIDRRFGAYEGERLYHFGISVDGYALAPPGIPVVLNPRSVLVLSVNVWDDELGRKLHEEPEQIVVFEGASPETIIGSGYARSREEQMQLLARNAARRIQLWMLRNPDWFNIDPDAAMTAAAEVEELLETSETGAPAETGSETGSETGLETGAETGDGAETGPETGADPTVDDAMSAAQDGVGEVGDGPDPEPGDALLPVDPA